jgi:hypothetical protein
VYFDKCLLSYNGVEQDFILYEYNEEKSRRRLIPVIYLGFLLLMGAIGNVLVLIIYPLRFPKTTRTIFITGLAIPDLLQVSNDSSIKTNIDASEYQVENVLNILQAISL